MEDIMLNMKKLLLIGVMVVGFAVCGFSTEAKDSNAGEKARRFPALSGKGFFCGPPGTIYNELLYLR
jgi:hypothetical protein